MGIPEDTSAVALWLRVVGGLQCVVDDRHEHPVVLYDAECGLCDRSIRFILKRDRDASFRFAALGSRVAQRLAPNAEAGSVVLVDGDGVHLRSEAAMRIAARLGAPWSWCRAARVIPKGWRDAAYDFVAARRYKWFGGAEACELPDPSWRERFLS
jgi:predicted DCC family thiol-disulfide oxidoreductase YuxK